MKKNNRKFLITMLIVIFIIMVITILTNASFSKVEYSTKVIYVASGDTLWTIASDEQDNNSYYVGKNIRDIIIDIKTLNNLESSFLYEGQQIEIPTL